MSFILSAMKIAVGQQNAKPDIISCNQQPIDDLWCRRTPFYCLLCCLLLHLRMQLQQNYYNLLGKKREPGRLSSVPAFVFMYLFISNSLEKKKMQSIVGIYLKLFSLKELFSRLQSLLGKSLILGRNIHNLNSIA